LLIQHTGLDSTGVDGKMPCGFDGSLCQIRMGDRLLRREPAVEELALGTL